MQKYLFFIVIIFVSCSQTFLEETKEIVQIEATISYKSFDDGIFLRWQSQWDFARVEIQRGNSPTTLSIYKDRLVQDQWMDSENMPGREYFYRVQAYNSKNRMIGQSKILTGYRSYRSIDQVVMPKDFITYLDTYPDRIELYWNGDVKDVFKIYRSDTELGAYQLIDELAFDLLSPLTFVDKNLGANKTYYYKVASIGINASGTVEEKITLPIEGRTKDVPTIISASVKDIGNPGSIAVSWKKDKTVNYYKIFRSSVQDDQYQLIADFIFSDNYVDKALPQTEGTVVDGQIKYPSYFYKIKSVSEGKESDFSAHAMGQAVHSGDILPAPEFTIALDQSSYPYHINFQWNKVSGEQVVYRLSKIDHLNNTNIIADNISALNYQISNEPFNTRWTYLLQAVNKSINLPGLASSKVYSSVTPAPPVITAVTTNHRTYLTNMRDVDIKSHVYWNNGSSTTMVGCVKKEWHVTSEVGYIDVSWDKQVASETVTSYTVYRRRKGTTDFVKVKEGLTDLSFRDEQFSEADYIGFGSGDNFKYPMYEYKVTAIYSGQESLGSSFESGSAINPRDILPAPEYVSVPAHWASGTGFGRAKWAAGSLSPRGVDQIVGLGGVNHMYLVWADVDSASTYRVRHSRGSSQEEWYSHDSDFPKDGNKKTRYLVMNNETTTASMTGMYVFSDGLPGWLGGKYSAESASFDVGSINGRAGYLLGDVRGILFTEPSTKPSAY